MPKQHWEANATASSEPFLIPYLFTNDATNKDTIATGPTAKQFEVPNMAYIAGWKTAAYNPLTGGKFANEE